MDVRTFHYQEGSSNKFWTISMDGASVTTHWGRIGTPGQTKTFDFDTVADAEKDYAKRIQSKTKEGYIEQTPAAPGASPQPVGPLSDEMLEHALLIMQIDRATIELHSSDPGNLTSYVAASEHGVVTDWRYPTYEVLHAFEPLLLRYGVRLGLSDDEDGPVVVTVTEGATVTRCELPGSDHEDADTRSLVFALDGQLPQTLAIYSLAECDDSDGYAYALLSRAKWDELQTLLGAHFPSYFARHPAAKTKKLAAPKPLTATKSKKINWQKDYDRGRRSEPADKPADEADRWWPVIDAFDVRCLMPVVGRSVVDKMPYNMKVERAFSASVHLKQRVNHEAEISLGEMLKRVADDLCEGRLDPWLMHGDPQGLATFLYEYAYAVLLGTRAQLLSMRWTPYRHITLGPLFNAEPIWAYFIFTALGRDEEARRMGDLIVEPSSREGLRFDWEKDRPAYHDLAVLLHQGTRGADLAMVEPIADMLDPASWSDPAKVAAAVQCHAQKRGQRFTHDFFRWTWPASLYALARRSGAREQLPADNPFLNRWLDQADVDFDSTWIRRLKTIDERLSQIDESIYPPAIPEPFGSVRARVDRVENQRVFGNTALHPSGGPEHEVRGKPAAKATPAPGELWEYKIISSMITYATETIGDLGQVHFRKTLFEGTWVKKLNEA